MKQAKPIDDPVVAEVRKARAELFAECGRDLHKLFAHIRRQEQQRGPNPKRRRKAVA